MVKTNDIFPGALSVAGSERKRELQRTNYRRQGSGLKRAH